MLPSCRNYLIYFIFLFLSHYHLGVLTFQTLTLRSAFSESNHIYLRWMWLFCLIGKSRENAKVGVWMVFEWGIWNKIEISWVEVDLSLARRGSKYACWVQHMVRRESAINIVAYRFNFMKSEYRSYIGSVMYSQSESQAYLLGNWWCPRCKIKHARDGDRASCRRVNLGHEKITFGGGA